MIFEWNDGKAKANLRKHRVPFEYAARVFLDDYRMEGFDGRKSYGEDRYTTIGMIEGQVYFVAFTERQNRAGDTVIRIISARKAGKHEERRYYQIRSGS